MATNALRHTHSGDPGQTFTIRVRVDHWGVWTEVRTLAPRVWCSVPHVTKISGDPFTEHGRGLLLVDQLATAWGTLTP